MNAQEATAWSAQAELPFAQVSVIELLEQRRIDHPAKVFISDYAGDVATYEEAARRARQLASGFAELGVTRGDVVALLMENSVDAVISMLALGYLGAVSAPINNQYKGELLTYVINDTTARHVVVDGVFADNFLAIAPDLDNFRGGAGHMIARGGQAGPGAGGDLKRSEFADIASRPQCVAIESTTQSDPFTLNYTSGTTGPSKGVLFPNGHVLTFAYDWVKCMGYRSDDILYSPMPLFHTLASILGIIPTLQLGATMHLDRRFSASNYWVRAAECDATIAHAIFSMIPFLLNQEPGDADRSHRVRKIWTGPSGYAKEFHDRFGVEIYEIYGQSEVGVVSYSPDWSSVPAGSCGRINERFEVRIVDANDNPVPVGTAGEVLVRPKVPFTTMLEYLGKPAQTAATWRNLWHHSGDHVRMDQDGWLYFVDRAKDMIRRRSENISAYEVELVLNRYPGAQEVAAFAVPSTVEDEEIKVCVVGAVGEEFDFSVFSEYCKDNLPKHMVPKYAELVSELPKTANQKIAKYKLKEAGITGSTGKTYDLELAAFVS